MATQLVAFAEPLPLEPNKQLITTPERFEKLIRFLESRPKIVIDYETSGLDYANGAHSIGMGLAAWTDSGQIWNAYVPYRHRTGERQLDFALVAPALKGLLENQAICKIAHNIKFEDHFSRREGWAILGPRYDTMIAARLYDENYSAKLENRAEWDLGIRDSRRWETRVHDRIVALARMNRLGIEAYKKIHGYEELGIELTAQYCGTDVEQTGLLYEFYERAGVSQLYARIWATEMALTSDLCDMEENGLPLDIPYLEDVKRQVVQAQEVAAYQINQVILGGHGINPGSDKEVFDLMWNRMGLRWTKKTKKGAMAVDEEVLSQFSATNAFCYYMLKWREANKIETTYTESLIAMCDPRGVLHPNFQSVGTVTGRLSCGQPNFQNMSADNDDRAIEFSGKKVEKGGVDPWSIRRAFPMRHPGWVRLFFDYSQVELRVLAEYSQDPIMIDSFLRREDLHQRTANEIGAVWGKECPRRVAKIANFGIAYCLSAAGLSRQAHIAESEAEFFMATFFARYSRVAAFREELWGEARRNHCQWTNIFGRTRRVPDLQSGDFRKAKSGERRLIGSAIQGTAAEFTKESIVRANRALKERRIPALLCNTVHDEIQIDTPREYMAEVITIVKPLMEYYPEIKSIPIIADVEWSDKTWADKQDYEEAV